MTRFIKSSKFFLILILVLNLFLYRQSLSFSFISDDFFYLGLNFTDIFTIKPGSYHYIPIFWSFIFFLKSVFGLNEFIFHLSAVIAHLTNIILLYYLSKRLLKSAKLALISSLLFSIFFSQYEVVFWVTGLSTSIMVMFFLLSFLSFIKYLNTHKRIYGLLFIILSILSVLTHEYALGLYPGIIFYWLFLKKKSKEAFPYIIISIISVLFIFFLPSLSKSSISPSLNNPEKILAYSSKIISYLFIPSPNILDMLPHIGYVIISFIILFILLKLIKNSPMIMFLSIWLILDILLISTTSAPQARYYYFLSIPEILLIVYIFRNHPKVLFIYSIFIIISGVSVIKTQEIFWQKASRITKETLKEVKKVYPDLQDGETIYIINFPDSINGPPWNAYLFRNGLESALSLTYKKNINLKYYRTISQNPIIRNDKLVNPKFINNLTKTKQRVFTFDYKTYTIKTL